MTVTDAVLVPLLRSDPAAPRVTHYDDAAGSRVELSGATAANWAAKTANWLRDGLGLAPGDRTAVLLPAHWQTAGVLFGAWWCGAVVTADPEGAAVALCAPDAVTAAVTGADEVAVVSLDPLGAGVSDPPAGVLDYAGEVRAHGDTFRPAALGPAAPATTASSVHELVADARRRAVELGLRPGDRVLSTMDWRPGDLVDGLLAVLAAHASLVQCTNPDGTVLPRRVRDERVTATLGVDVPGVRRAG